MTATISSAKTHLLPTQVARDTFVIHDHVGEGVAPAIVPVNSMLIRGAEPVVVDTGLAANGDGFFADLFGLVEPEDIRWVFVSHDDIDHTGNIDELMELAPNATLVVNWFLQERLGPTLSVSPLRQRWVGDNEVLDAGDRRLVAVRPPVYDSPTTRGLYDTTTGVYWASDAFGTPVETPTRDAAELSPEMFEMGVATFSRYLAPWLEIADPARYDMSVDRVAALAPSVIAGCHGPIVSGRLVDRAIEVTRTAPTAPILPQPDQQALEAIQQQILSVQDEPIC